MAVTQEDLHNFQQFADEKLADGTIAPRQGFSSKSDKSPRFIYKACIDKLCLSTFFVSN